MILIKQRFNLMIERPLLGLRCAMYALELPRRATLEPQGPMNRAVTNSMPGVANRNSVKTLGAEVILAPVVHRAKVEGYCWLTAFPEGAYGLSRNSNRLSDIHVSCTPTFALIMHRAHALAGDGSLASLNGTNTTALSLSKKAVPVVVLIVLLAHPALALGGFASVYGACNNRQVSLLSSGCPRPRLLTQRGGLLII